MNEQEMREEIERLNRELSAARKDRDNLHTMLCGMLPVEEVQPTQQDLQEMKEKNITIVDLLHDPRFFSDSQANGVRNGDRSKAMQPETKRL